MAQYYFVDINTSADGSGGIGSYGSPYDYSGFMTQLAVLDEATDTNYFLLMGERELSASGLSTTDPIGADNVWIVSKKNVYIQNWNENPWRIYTVSDFYLNNYVDYADEVHIVGGFLQTSALSVRFSISDDANIYFENCWINGSIDDGSSVYSTGKFYFIGCTLSNFRMILTNFEEVRFINTIISNAEYSSYLVDNATVLNTYFDNVVVYNRYIFSADASPSKVLFNPSVIIPPDGYSLNNTFFILQQTQVLENFAIESISATLNKDVSAISADEINYLTENLISISIDGNTSYGADNYWFGGRRDGVGALYFEELNNNVSASLSAGYYDDYDDEHISIPNTSANYYATKVFSIDGTEILTSTSGGVLSASLSAIGSIGLHIVDVDVTSLNNWYTNENSYTFSAYDYPLSGTLIFLDLEYNQITSAGMGDTIILSATNIGYYNGGAGLSGLGSYSIDYLGTGSTLLITNTSSTDGISGTYAYDAAGLYAPIIILYPLAISNPENFSMTSVYTALDTSFTYYANINESYDASGSNAGTITDPFNMSEFIDRITDSAIGSGSTFKVQGFRSYNTPFTVNNRGLIIDGWDLSATGPWVLGLDCSNYQLDERSFATVTLKNGIIYTLPYIYYSNYYGCNIVVSNMYDVFVLSQGDIGANISIYGTSALSANIYGCTLRADSGYLWSGEATSCGISIVDSVFTITSADDSFTDLNNMEIYNCAFDASSGTVSSTFSADVLSACQFNWTPPSDVNYPFHRTNALYNQSISYIISNNYILNPFDGLTCPPNPGHTAPTFSGYDTGLFGTLRTSMSSCEV